jgi:hypothetical protein
MHPEAKLINGEALYEFIKQKLGNGEISISSLKDLDETGGSFRVTCTRIGGPHAFRAPEVER